VRHELKSSSLRQIVFLPVFVAVISGLFFPPCTQADTFEDAARELAQKITSVLPAHDTAAFTLQNRSSLSSADVAAIRRAVENALVKNGIRVVPDGQSAPPHIHITLCETLTAYQWVADVRRNDSSNIFMIKIGRDVERQASQPLTSLVIRRALLWEQDRPILDVAVPIAPSGLRKMLVLEPKQISFFRWQGDRWLLDGATPLPKATAMERAPRGMLNYRRDAPDTFDAVFEKEICRASIQGSAEFRCEAAAGRQLFLLPDPRLAARFAEIEKKIAAPLSSAKLDLLGRSVLLLTSPDGMARMYEEEAEPVATFAGWGSEIAAVQSGCGTGWQLFATGKGDWTTPDTVQAYEIRDRQAMPVSAAIDFAGPITSLRSSDNSRAALAVVKNLTTQHYEAYHLSVTCEK
jgi:hypothetical protein